MSEPTPTRESAGFRRFDSKAHSAATRVQAKRGYDALWEGVDIDDTGYVYLIKYGNEQRVKIGYATNIASRLSNLASAHHEAIVLVYARWVDNAAWLESHLHTTFHSKQLGHEWFGLTEEDTQYAIDIMQCHDGEDYTR